MAHIIEALSPPTASTAPSPSTMTDRAARSLRNLRRSWTA